MINDSDLFVKLMLQNILLMNQRPRAAIQHCSKIFVVEEVVQALFEFKIQYLLSESWWHSQNKRSIDSYKVLIIFHLKQSLAYSGDINQS